ncbi:MAG: rhodanese-like domain-containing protein [Verrucomicrobiales bacterium]|nr:rhodanese-like domain-containing protein [Verrucomicrobiales bacterium]MBP9223205.1 rhodanese-like domain-containing protein [Verrucomicrobiales bacterium]HQZ26550.1 rhodanese-like domain-containing protein [Verrucomicrobiales bacterium]
MRIFQSSDMGTGKQIGWILLLAVLAGTASAFLHPRKAPWFATEDPSEMRWKIGVIEAKALLADGPVFWIDARSRSLYTEKHLPGAILLNPEDWGNLMFENQEALQAVLSQPVVVYCDGETCTRSGEVAARLRELLGLDPVYVLDGDWRELLPLVTLPTGLGEPTQ